MFTVEDIPKLDGLFSERYIGIDSEWRPTVAAFLPTKVALLQISGYKKAYLIDMYNLGESPELD